ncbi:hypothetical protein VTO42DRAFT_5788 [Malbranchea cinnamomea]
MGKLSLNALPPSTSTAACFPAQPPSSSAVPASNDEHARPAPKRPPSKRRTLSCLPCRQHKLKCDRHVPCHSCIRYRREEQCRQNPPPSSVMSGGFGLARFAPAIAPVADATTSSASAAALSSSSSSSLSSSSSSKPALVAGEIPPHYTAAYTRPLLRPSTSPSPATVAAPPQPPALAPGSTAAGVVVPRSRLSSTPHPVPETVVNPWQPTVSLGGTAVLPHGLPFLGPAGQGTTQHNDLAAFWKSQLMTVLPLRAQCDLLVSYYTEHMDWVYHGMHIPSFYKEYHKFWDTDLNDVDLIWLSLLFTIISCAALYVPLSEAAKVGLDKSKLRDQAHVWHQASRQALHAGGFESKPCLTQLLTFIVTQLYWLATRNVETLNSNLGQAVRNAQALGLDKDTPGANPLETQIRRLIWWELFNCDAYQSICLERAPLIHTSAEKVSFPLNCDDSECTETSVEPKPLDVPTDTSANILRAKIFIIFRKLFYNDSELLSDFYYIQSIDNELEALVANFPWYFQTESCQRLLPHRETIAWQYHMVHSLLCMQRIRMHRPFLQQQIGASWEVCARAARDVLSVYKILRTPDIERLRRSQKFYVQAYQIYSAAVAQAAFLLVEQSFPVETIREDVEMVISDLSLGGLDGMGVSTMKDGKRILRKMLDMHDRRGQTEPLESESLVPEISAVFGGEQTTRKYLKRCEISYVLNGEPSTGQADDGNLPNKTSQEPLQFVTNYNPLSAFADAFCSVQPNAAHMFDLTNGEHWDSVLRDDIYQV